MHRGYIKVWRKIKDSGLYQLPETLALFMFILTESTHQPRRIGNTMLNRGQYSSGRIELARQLKQSEQTIRTGLARLAKLEILTIETTNHGSIYTIVNYSIYQDNDGSANQPLNQPLTNEQPAANQPLTNEQPHNKNINTKHINTEECNKERSAAFALPDWIDKTQWDLWLKTRKGKKMTSDQMQANVNKLTKWRDAGMDYCGALADAAAGGWQGLHQPKQSSLANRQSSNEQIKAAAYQRLFGEKEIESI